MYDFYQVFSYSFFPKKKTPILRASQRSCIESDKIAILPVKIHPKNSKIENEIFRMNAIKIFFSVFIMFLLLIKVDI